METLVLPAHDQFTRRQDRNSRRAAGVIHSPRMLHSHRCSSSSQVGPDFPFASGKFDSACDGHVHDVSHGGFMIVSEKQSSLFDAKVSVFDGAYVSSAARRQDSPSPKGSGSRRQESPKQEVGLQDSVTARHLCELNQSSETCTREICGHVLHRSFVKNYVGLNGHTVGRLERSSSEVCVSISDLKGMANKSSLDLIARERPKSCGKVASVVRGVRILPRPVNNDEALGNLAKLLGGEETTHSKQQRMSSSAACPPIREGVPMQPVFDGADCQNPVSENGCTSKTSKSRLKKYLKQSWLKDTSVQVPAVGSMSVDTVDGLKVIKQKSKDKDNGVPSGLKIMQSKPKAKENGFIHGLKMLPTKPKPNENGLLEGLQMSQSKPKAKDNVFVDGLKSTQLNPKAKENGFKNCARSSSLGECQSPCSQSICIPVNVCWQDDILGSSSPPLSERWAGPAFSNSPPPSSLPLPTFSIRQSRTSSLEIPLTEGEFFVDGVANGFSSAPGTPLRRFCSLPSDSRTASGFPSFSQDVASATKDLRRILNLDQKT